MGRSREVSHIFGTDVLTFEPRHSLVKEQTTLCSKDPATESLGSVAHVVPPNAGDSTPVESGMELSKFGDDPARTAYFAVPGASSPTSRQ
jgi:hypothetical protein